jgi:predicted Zn-dependent protease
LFYVAVLSREQFDSIEYDAAASGDHVAAAREMTTLAMTGTETAGMPRAEAFLRAGEQWLLADQPAEAVAGFRRAMADGGPVFADPRIPLARALFELGRNLEAQALISQVKAERPADPRTCDLVAELLVERQDLAGALDWATAGVELCLTGDRGLAGQGDESELRLLLRLRYRIRNDLGLPEDDYDAMLDDA